MKMLLGIALLLGGLLGTGCSDACSEASEKTEECGIVTETVEEDEAEGEVDCGGAVECAAECVNQATCQDLQNRSDPETDFAKCVGLCSDSSS